MTDVFISYKRRLRPRVEEIATALRALGLTVWYDAALEAGASFSAEISNEVRHAGCVLVCWSDDAFPHGGDSSGWVVGEATVGQGRGRLVPVLLDDTELDPPWNTLHTESLIGWTPEARDHAGWRATLAAIGRHIGRPDLAGDAAGLVAGEVLVAKPHMPSSSVIAVTALAAAVITAIGAVLLAAIDPRMASGYWALVPGAALAAVPLALLFWCAGVLGAGRALALVAAFAVAFAIAAFLGILAISPLPFRNDPNSYDLSEIIVSVVAGLVGAGLSLGTFPLLGLAAKSRTTWLRIGVSSLALAIVAGFIAAMPFFNLEIGNSAIIWLAAIWQLVYAPLLVWVLRPQAARSASSM
ncbi:MAG: toll/interleukin-1 receptor domain-containing protein [Devosia sp.]